VKGRVQHRRSRWYRSRTRCWHIHTDIRIDARPESDLFLSPVVCALAEDNVGLGYPCPVTVKLHYPTAGAFVPSAPSDLSQAVRV